MKIANCISAYKASKHNEEFQIDDLVIRINYYISKAAEDGFRKTCVFVPPRYSRKTVKEACRIFREQGYSCVLRLIDNDIIIRW